MMIFRKKPIEHECRQWDGTEQGANELIEWMGNGIYSPSERVNFEIFKPELRIFTLEDGAREHCKHVASPDDWIVKGVNGEFHPVKPDIFVQLYESTQNVELNSPPRIYVALTNNMLSGMCVAGAKHQAEMEFENTDKVVELPENKDGWSIDSASKFLNEFNKNPNAIKEVDALWYFSSDEITEKDTIDFVNKIKKYGFEKSIPKDAQAAMRSWAECEPSEENSKYLKAFTEIARLALGIE